jgi:hypothetical protein
MTARLLQSRRKPYGLEATHMAEMKTCDTCGNDYDKTIDIVKDGQIYTFDSFECAIHKLAPVCAQCGIRIIGHGLERDGTYYCCEHCAGLEK